MKRESRGGRMPGRQDDNIRCSFCGKTQEQVRKMIAGSNGVYICDDCIELCAEILEEELGDVLLQVVMHARIAEERGDFNFSDVVDGVCRKMIRRHPHVFGNETFSTREEQLSSWRKIKELEKIEKKRKARELAENKE